ncbi:sigma-E factor negative regulatory protein [Paludibacterium yongneupense]|uniref:sigma-E factor negative regulatory protein n=1 Tax=Paludibacterium yongneupense TaxID=400061 RepID=UPI000402391C|nr:sigma-E factor negative regulatory protein [Paludibacterium yongneupense]
MKESVSALMDGELGADEAARVIAAIGADESLKETWSRYHLIGDAMRSGKLSAINVENAVSARLAEEPTVLAPRRWLGSTRRRSTVGAMALAASVSFAAVIAWQQLATPATGPIVAEGSVPVQVRPLQAVADNEDPYFLAHQDMTSDSGVLKVAYGSGVRH